MGLLLRDGRSLALILSLVFLFWLPSLRSQPSNSSPGSQMMLDALLQHYAYQALVHPRTGIAYEGTVPSNLTGIQISAMRVRRGSLRTRGITTYREFEIPTGLKVQSNVERLVLVYQNLGNWSSSYYSLSGYTNLAPVLGLLSYDASNLSATNLPQLNLMASGEQPITIRFPEVGSVPQGSVAMCVWFDLQGLASFSNVASGNTCSTRQQGHFSIVAKYTAPAPSPPPAAAPSPAARRRRRRSSISSSGDSRVWIIVCSVLGGGALLFFLGFLAVCVRKYRKKKRMTSMERAAEAGESLNMKTVGNVRAPAAMGTRTQPAIEHESYT